MKKIGRVEFEGTADPTFVGAHGESVLTVRVLRCYKISVLYFNTQKDSYDLWVSVPNAKVKPLVVTCDNFLKEFHMKYVPPAYCDVKKKELLNLRKQGMFVGENE